MKIRAQKPTLLVRTYPYDHIGEYNPPPGGFRTKIEKQSIFGYFGDIFVIWEAMNMFSQKLVSVTFYLY